MARRYGGSDRKKLKLTKAEGELALARATKKGLSASAYGRELIESFVEKGSDYVAPEHQVLQIIAEPELIARAEEKARVGYGCSLGEILRFEIAKR